ncbi:FliH/SctL family protein [Thermodesulfobium sp.]|jgi:flagellar assembly protein FliH
MKIKSTRVLKNVCLLREYFVVPIRQQPVSEESDALPEVTSEKEETFDKQELIKQAMDEIEKIKEQAKKDGFELGYKEGLKRAEEEAEMREKERAQILKDNLSRLNRENKEYLERIENRLEEEAFNIVVKSISQILRSNKVKDIDLLKERIRSFLREIPPNVEIKIRVSGADVDKFEDFEMPLEVDYTLKSGDFIIKTDLGFLDGRIKSLEDNFLKELKRVFE